MGGELITVPGGKTIGGAVQLFTGTGGAVHVAARSSGWPQTRPAGNVQSGTVAMSGGGSGAEPGPGARSTGPFPGAGARPSSFDATKWCAVGRGGFGLLLCEARRTKVLQNVRRRRPQVPPQLSPPAAAVSERCSTPRRRSRCECECRRGNRHSANLSRFMSRRPLPSPITHAPRTGTAAVWHARAGLLPYMAFNV